MLPRNADGNEGNALVAMRAVVEMSSNIILRSVIRQSHVAWGLLSVPFRGYHLNLY